MFCDGSIPSGFSLLGLLAAIPFFLLLFAFGSLWEIILFFGAWIVFLPPKGLKSWSLLFLISLAAGLYVSWTFQSVRPFDVYHEEDGSKPGWEPVYMASPTTVICCAATAISVALTALILSRFGPQKAFSSHAD
jgi:hypothetical protein